MFFPRLFLMNVSDHDDLVFNMLISFTLYDASDAGYDYHNVISNDSNYKASNES